jgi:hypothetical protein
MKLSSKKLANVVSFVLFVPIALIGLFSVAIFLLFFGAYAAAGNIVRERRFKRRMKTLGRVLAKRQFLANLSSGGSMLIEKPSMGWNITRAWWTSDDIIHIAPMPPATAEEWRQAARQELAHKWDCWCWDNYTSPESGKAYLLRVWNGVLIEKWLKQNYPLVPVVHTWSGPIQFGFQRSDGADPSEAGPLADDVPEMLT